VSISHAFSDRFKTKNNSFRAAGVSSSSRQASSPPALTEHVGVFRTIADALVARGVKLALGSSVCDPADPMGKMFFNILATF
jgi:hypothetical protein